MGLSDREASKGWHFGCPEMWRKEGAHKCSTIIRVRGEAVIRASMKQWEYREFRKANASLFSEKCNSFDEAAVDFLREKR